MSEGRKKGPRPPTQYEHDLQQAARLYKESHPGPFSLIDVAQWMIDTGRWERQRGSAIRELMKHLQQALRGVTFKDEDGKPVRVYHAVPTGEGQGRLWAEMPEMSNEQFKASLQARNSGAFGVVKQIHRDQNYFNKHHNSGDPIQLSFNYDARLEDEKHSAEYVDQPPPDDDPELLPPPNA